MKKIRERISSAGSSTATCSVDSCAAPDQRREPAIRSRSGDSVSYLRFPCTADNAACGISDNYPSCCNLAIKLSPASPIVATTACLSHADKRNLRRPASLGGPCLQKSHSMPRPTGREVRDLVAEGFIPVSDTAFDLPGDADTSEVGICFSGMSMSYRLRTEAALPPVSSNIRWEGHSERYIYAELRSLLIGELGQGLQFPHSFHLLLIIISYLSSPVKSSLRGQPSW